MRFQFISTKTGQYPVAWMCRRLRVSRAGYYAWRCRKPSARAQRDGYLTVRIRALFEAFDGTYGSPRIHDELVAQGHAVSRKRVIRIMQQEDLCAHLPRKFRKTTDSNHNQPVAENIVNRNFTPAEPNQLWASDISCVRTWQGWVYLAVVLDLYSRRVVGWATADHMRTELPLEALRMAIATRRPSAGLIHHSDRGSQYASDAYQDALAQHGFTCSMSRKGNCWDNSVVESFFATIKKDLIYRHSWPSARRVAIAIERYVSFYNARRRHSALGSLCPMHYEAINSQHRLPMAA